MHTRRCSLTPLSLPTTVAMVKGMRLSWVLGSTYVMFALPLVLSVEAEAQAIMEHEMMTKQQQAQQAGGAMGAPAPAGPSSGIPLE